MIKLIDIHEDKRGYIKAIENMLPDGREFAFLEVKKGYARGGCLHTEDEYLTVVKGKIKLYLGDKEEIISEGESKKILKNVPHAFVGITDSIVAEWGIKTEEKQKDIKVPSLRKVVDDINKK